jgi:hypothetical protein
MDPGGKIYIIDELRCWKVENLDDERYDENKNEGGGYRVEISCKTCSHDTYQLLFFLHTTNK